jgi:hypothetical protein
MTSLLRRKHPITRRAATPAWIICSLAVALASGGAVVAQPAPKKEPPSTAGLPIQLEIPDRERVFRLDTEEQLERRLQKEYEKNEPNKSVEFPPRPDLSGIAYQPRQFQPAQRLIEPHYVMHDKLFFHEANSERYGWELGFLQPIISSAQFFKDVALVSAHLVYQPCKNESSAGYCLPGDPVPYLIYPPKVNVAGGVVEAGTILAITLPFVP